MILKELDEIVQSSSMVECINSIVRQYINNTRSQISQESNKPGIIELDNVLPQSLPI